jgi:hypothetical protein
MPIQDDLLQALRLWQRLPAGELTRRLNISRATLMRAVRLLGERVVSRGKARRTAYAARRAVRGSTASISLFQIDRAGGGAAVATIDPVYPHGCAVAFAKPFEWPLLDEMRDGWFPSLPYPLDDMRPQGFLGRHFARRNANLLEVSDNPTNWSEDDVLHALALLGADLPGNYIVGEPAYRRFLADQQASPPFVPDADMERTYLAQAQDALQFGDAGSSAGGEFPKFTQRRLIDGVPTHVIVKFSGAGDAPGTQRWSDLLVCEHLALETVAQHLHIAAATSRLYHAGGRTFLEVQRFDRHGAFGRSGVCSWAAINHALFALPGKPWTAGAAALHQQAFITDDTARDIARIWHFGQLIGNTDMHDGNLAFQPGLVLAPVYDMLPMLYAPVTGVELPQRTFSPGLPLPVELSTWRESAGAALVFWQLASQDKRISTDFRRICLVNANLVQALLDAPASSVEVR